MARGMEGFGGEAGILPLYFPGGGSEAGVWAGGEGEVPDLYADAGEFFRVSGGFVLLDEQPYSPFVRGSSDAGGWPVG